MKKINIILSLFFISPLTMLDAQIVANGGFEDGSGSGETRNFDVTSNWFNRGTGDQTQVARRENTDTGSSFVGQLNDRYDVVNATGNFDDTAFGAITHSQKTSHTIQSNDQFDFSYEWQDAFNWNDGLDEIRFVMFATDNDALGGNVVWSSVHDSGTSSINDTYESVTGTSSIIGAGAVGQVLFVNIYGFQNNGALSANTGFARFDNISVTAVPEPATIGLISGLAVLGLVVYRRKKN